MSTVNVTVGHKVNATLVFLDQDGNPMLKPQVADAPPAWSNTTAATGTLVAAPDGLSAVETALAAGTDEIDVDMKVGGVEFKASVGVIVAAAPQVLTSVAIATTVA
jgi:hypothetical protein